MIWTQHNTKFLGFFTILAVFILQFFIVHVSIAAPLQVQALDSIAGYGSDITVANVQAHTPVTLFVQPPLGDIYEEEKKSDNTGTVIFSFPEALTKNTGTYKAVAVRKGQGFEDGPITPFQIFADDPSSTQSQIESKNVSRPLGENTSITVLLKDKHSNPVADHRVRLISSRSSDTITPQNTYTNTRGEITFSIASHQAGSSTFTAIDDTADITISKRVDILFYKNKTSNNIGNNPYSASMFPQADAAEEDPYGSISSFDIDFPNTVTADSDENYLTITALDTERRTVKNYMGSIVIRIPTDPNAELPGNDGKYLFLTKDQGKFTFPRSVVFSQTGNHALEVFLYDDETQEININIFGKKTITVEEKSGNPISTDEDAIEIISPSYNSKFSTPSISIRGNAKPDSDVKIFLDNSAQQEVPVNSQGIFTTTIDDLSEGKHFLYALQKQGSRAASEEILFTIDTNVAAFNEASFAPQKIAPQEKVTITVLAEKNLDTVKATWDSKSEFLSEVSDGKYQLTFEGPKNAGSYPITITLTDKNNNSLEKNIDTPLVVQEEEQNTGEIALTGSFEVATQDFHISWSNDSSNTPIIYIIQAGKTIDDLKKRKSITGSKNSAVIDTLEIGGSYVFQIIPVNQNGEEGTPSNTIELQSFAPPTPEPTAIVTPTPLPIADLSFQINPSQNALALTWDTKPGAQQYTIEYGLQSGQYIEKKSVLGSVASTTLHDLIPTTPYFIKLTATDALGFEIENYGEKTSSPLGAQFHAAPNVAPVAYPEWIVESGASLYLLLSALLLFMGGVTLLRRR